MDEKLTDHVSHGGFKLIDSGHESTYLVCECGIILHEDVAPTQQEV